jgi:hypothetical protein
MIPLRSMTNVVGVYRHCIEWCGQIVGLWATGCLAWCCLFGKVLELRRIFVPLMQHDHQFIHRA